MAIVATPKRATRQDQQEGSEWGNVASPVLVPAGLALLAAACGDDDDGASSAPSASPSEVQPAEAPVLSTSSQATESSGEICPGRLEASMGCLLSDLHRSHHVPSAPRPSRFVASRPRRP